MGRYFTQPSTTSAPNVYLGSGTTFGNGYTDRNVNLGYGLPSMAPNPEFSKDNPYGIGDDQVIMNEGTPNAMIVGKDAPRGWFGIPRALTGAVDAITNTTFLPDTDWDKRGTGRDSYGNLPKPGELGAAPVKVPEMVMSNTLGINPQVGGSPVPSNMNMGQYLLENTGIGLGNQFLGQWQMNKTLDNIYARELQARKDSGALDIMEGLAKQRSDKGQSERATEEQDRREKGAAKTALNAYRQNLLGQSTALRQTAINSLARQISPAHSSASIFARA